MNKNKVKALLSRTTGSTPVKDSRIKNLSKFLHNLGVADEQVNAVADGTISDIDRNFLIFSCRR